ncbi:hypothetical protein OS493_027260 [Desmophyllum pertusum]|uniref:Uncharacterized protein n=1 Tax=Desmophyllum pertusum TaxID=174260 RepID=A0A9X0CX79_9CNID|nr:hypothetical protein OS493_027260 [Desmophyllum pertusum]
MLVFVPFPYALSLRPTVITASVGVQVRAPYGGNFVQDKVALRWLNQMEDMLTYTSSYICGILTRVLNFTCEKSGDVLTINVSPEEDIRLCRIANGDVDEEDDDSENENEAEMSNHDDHHEVTGQSLHQDLVVSLCNDVIVAEHAQYCTSARGVVEVRHVCCVSWLENKCEKSTYLGFVSTNEPSNNPGEHLVAGARFIHEELTYFYLDFATILERNPKWPKDSRVERPELKVLSPEPEPTTDDYGRWADLESKGDGKSRSSCDCL